MSTGPAIVLIAPDHPDEMRAGLARYVHEYDVHLTASCHGALTTTRDILQAGGTVAMVVSESQLPDAEVLHCFAKLREKVPTARRVVAAHWEHFLAGAPALRPAMARGEFDAYLLMPRGTRDEEFHHAITEILSDWGSTVPDPEVVSVKIISPVRDSLTLSIRDFLDRMGMPNRIWAPDSDAGRYVLERWEGEPVYPLVFSGSGTVTHARTVRDVAISVYGAPTEIDIDRVVDVAIVGGGPAGLAAAVYARLGRTLDDHPRGRGDRRPGGHELDDPQLSRLPPRHLGHAARPAGTEPGAALRCALLHRSGRRRDAGRRRR